MLRIAFIGNSESIHCVRWVNGLSARGVSVVLISAHSGIRGIDQSVDVRVLSTLAPLGYVIGARQVRRILAETKPDLVNAHYATGYGLLARLSGCRPLVLSVWGADVFDFPHKSRLHAWLLRGNLEAADVIASTSECMANQTKRIINSRPVYVTPFGVDTHVFYPRPKPVEMQDQFVVGTVKTLSNKYGIDSLIMVFAQVWNELGRPLALRLEIGGDGEDRELLERLCKRLGIGSQVHFHGQVPHSAVPGLIQRMDVFVALSRLDSESFGVAAVEAAACGKPVLVSDAQGLAEVTIDGVTGIVVPRDDVRSAAIALRQLITDSGLRQRMGVAGRQRVQDHYSWEISLDLMLAVYRTTLCQQ